MVICTYYTCLRVPLALFTYLLPLLKSSHGYLCVLHLAISNAYYPCIRTSMDICTFYPYLKVPMAICTYYPCLSVFPCLYVCLRIYKSGFKKFYTCILQAKYETEAFSLIFELKKKKRNQGFTILYSQDLCFMKTLHLNFI